MPGRVSPDFGRGRPLEPELERSLAEASGILASLGCAVVESDPPIMTEGDEMAPGVWAYFRRSLRRGGIPGARFLERSHKGDDLRPRYAYPIYDAVDRAGLGVQEDPPPQPCLPLRDEGLDSKTSTIFSDRLTGAAPP